MDEEHAKRCVFDSVVPKTWKISVSNHDFIVFACAIVAYILACVCCTCLQFHFCAIPNFPTQYFSEFADFFISACFRSTTASRVEIRPEFLTIGVVTVHAGNPGASGGKSGRRRRMESGPDGPTAQSQEWAGPSGTDSIFSFSPERGVDRRARQSNIFVLKMAAFKSEIERCLRSDVDASLNGRVLEAAVGYKVLRRKKMWKNENKTTSDGMGVVTLSGRRLFAGMCADGMAWRSSKRDGCCDVAGQHAVTLPGNFRRDGC
jgi:hypothetical protein